LAVTRTDIAKSPPPNLRPLLEAQSAAAHFYVWLTIIYVTAGLALLAAPAVVYLPAEEFKLALRVGGALIAWELFHQGSTCSAEIVPTPCR
jgi:hypothetical protein